MMKAEQKIRRCKTLLNQARVQNILVVSDVEAEKLRVLQATGFNVIRCLTKETRP